MLFNTTLVLCPRRHFQIPVVRKTVEVCREIYNKCSHLPEPVPIFFPTKDSAQEASSQQHSCSLADAPSSLLPTPRARDCFCWFNRARLIMLIFYRLGLHEWFSVRRRHCNLAVVRILSRGRRWNAFRWSICYRHLSNKQTYADHKKKSFKTLLK